MSYIIVTLLIKIMIFWENGTFAIDKFNVILEEEDFRRDLNNNVNPYARIPAINDTYSHLGYI